MTREVHPPYNHTHSGGNLVLRLHSIFIACLFFACAGVACKRPPKTDAEEKLPRVSAPVSKWSDTDRDGFPDAAELRSFDDRENFRRWFTAIAEMQFYSQSEEWNAEQRDCAGLVRFAMREALRKHDRPWLQKMGSDYEPVAPDVRTYTLENSPLGEKLFRTGDGVFEETDLQSARFSEFADARTLRDFNSKLVSRDRAEARPGDLLFYHQPWVQNYPYHVMIFIGEAREAGEGARDWVVYHTGSSPSDEGLIKKVRLAVLDRHPNRRWRPVQSNPHFLGFYRLRLLDES